MVKENGRTNWIILDLFTQNWFKLKIAHIGWLVRLFVGIICVFISSYYKVLDVEYSIIQPCSLCSTKKYSKYWIETCTCIIHWQKRTNIAVITDDIYFIWIASNCKYIHYPSKILKLNLSHGYWESGWSTQRHHT